VRPLFDTNILIDLTEGSQAAADVLNQYPDPAISIITWIEVLTGVRAGQESQTNALLDRFAVLPLTEAVAAAAVELRRSYRLKLPDAVIWATARITGRTLVTRDVKDFPADDPGVNIPYRLG